MIDKNTNIDDMTDEEVVDGLVSELGRIYTDMSDGATRHKPVQMTEAELWESLIPPFQD